MEGLILLASVIMRKCCPRNKLPLGNIRSVVKYDLPESELYPPEGFGKCCRNVTLLNSYYREFGKLGFFPPDPEVQTNLSL